MKITNSFTIGEVMQLSDKMESVFLGFGMHCLYCPVSQFETLEEAAIVHGIDIELLIEKLNEQLK